MLHEQQPGEEEGLLQRRISTKGAEAQFSACCLDIDLLAICKRDHTVDIYELAKASFKTQLKGHLGMQGTMRAYARPSLSCKQRNLIRE